MITKNTKEKKKKNIKNYIDFLFQSTSNFNYPNLEIVPPSQIFWMSLKKKIVFIFRQCPNEQIPSFVVSCMMLKSS